MPIGGRWPWPTQAVNVSAAGRQEVIPLALVLMRHAIWVWLPYDTCTQMTNTRIKKSWPTKALFGLIWTTSLQIPWLGKTPLLFIHLLVNLSLQFIWSLNRAIFYLLNVFGLYIWSYFGLSEVPLSSSSAWVGCGLLMVPNSLLAIGQHTVDPSAQC